MVACNEVSIRPCVYQFRHGEHLSYLSQPRPCQTHGFFDLAKHNQLFVLAILAITIQRFLPAFFIACPTKCGT